MCYKMIRKKDKSEKRTDTQLRGHYKVEIGLAAKLRNSSKEERLSASLYTSLYDSLFKLVPNHTQIIKKANYEKKYRALIWQLGLLGHFNLKGKTFLEVGGGDCSLALEVATMAKKVFAIDVSNVITDNLAMPLNFELIISDGCSIRLPKNSVDIVYSNQLMEHLHPDDALEQLQNIFNVLKPGGIYICVTPNKVGGPWDISKYFDTEAKGFHLQEFTMAELVNIFRGVGFSKMSTYIGARGTYAPFSISFIVLAERILFLFPYSIRVKIANSLIVRALLGIKLVGIK